jgi:hypothetical protein
MDLLLKFKSIEAFQSATDLKQFFNTTEQNLFKKEDSFLTPSPTLKLILRKQDVYFPLVQTVTDVTDGILVEVDQDEFYKKLAANEFKFELDEQNMRLTLARGLAAAIMSQTHADGLHEDLTADDKTVDLLPDLQAHAISGLYVVPVVIMVYFAMQYGYHYYKTGGALPLNSPQVKQMVHDSLSLGIQTFIIALSFAIARTLIPLLLHALSVQPSGPLIHLALAPLFGLIFASSLLAYDLMAAKTTYGQLTVSPMKRFFKNLTIGTGLYLVQLIPGLGAISGSKVLATSVCAFAVPNTINVASNCFWHWGRQMVASSKFSFQTSSPRACLSA